MCVFIPALVALLLCVSPARALTVQVSPDAPVAGDVVTVTVSGAYPHSCWHTAGYSCGELVGQTIDVNISSYDSWWAVCAAVITPYEVACTYTFPAAGTYTLRAHDLGESLRDPYEHEVSCAIVVAEHVGVERVSWASFKARYR